MNKLILHTDGAAKGNPGPAGIGVVLYRDGEAEPLAAIGEGIGTATNNVAEYRALLRGLSEALLRGADEVEVRTDSELMARQLSGRYRVTSPLLLPLYEEARRLLARFHRATVAHVLREKNVLADKLANQGVAGAATPPAAPDERPGPPEPSSEEPRSPFSRTYSTVVDGERRIYNVERLWELARALPVETVPLDSVSSVLDQDCWFGGKAPTLRQVGEHARRILNADFSHPILLNARGELMDGGHRLVRAWLDGKTEIDAVRFPEDPEPDIRRPA